MKKAYLHIGMPKTGTTAIQTTFNRCREELKANGLWYPIEGDSTNCTGHILLLPKFHKLSVDHFYFKNKGIKPNEAADASEKFFDSIEKESDTYSGDLILSTEYLWNMTPDKIEECDNYFSNLGYQLNIICYVRHPFDQATSSIQQNVKQNSVDLYDSLKIPNWRRLRNGLSPFLQLLRRERLFICDYSETKKNGVELNLLERIKYRGNLKQIPCTRTNESLSMAGVLLADAYNKLRNTGEPNLPNYSFLFKVGGSKFFLPSALIESMREEAEQDVEWVETKLGLRLQASAQDRSYEFGQLSGDAAMDIIRLLNTRAQ